MKVINFAEQNSVINHYMAQLRDKSYQKNRHVMRPELRRKINAHLGFYFEHYGYEMQED